MSKFKAVITKLNGNIMGSEPVYNPDSKKYECDYEYVGYGSTVEIAVKRVRQKAIEDGRALISGEITVERKTTSQSDYFNGIEYRYYNTFGI